MSTEQHASPKTTTSLESLLSTLSPLAKERGTEFEELIHWLLTSDPVYKKFFRRVWHWREWDGLDSQGRTIEVNPGPDHGIDLVAETSTGEMVAVQCKCVAESSSLGYKGDLATFLARSTQFQHRYLFATTNHLSHQADRELERHGVHRVLRTQLETLTWPRDLASRNGQLAPVVRTLYPYQKAAVADIVAGLVTRGQLHSAPGTGKTITALSVAKRLGTKRTLILVPSIHLVGQMIADIPRVLQADFLAVCSDIKVGSEVERASDLLMPATTDPAQIAAFLASRGPLPKFVVATYQSSEEIERAQAEFGAAGFDLAICDEAHHTAGARKGVFGTILDADRIVAAKRLFMTATPRIVDPKSYDEAEVHLISSMDDEDVYGPVLHKLPLRKAIDDGILCDYEVHILGVEDPKLCEALRIGVPTVLVDGEEINTQIVASQVALRRAATDLDLRSVLTFHNRVSSSQQFARSFFKTPANLLPAMAPRGYRASSVDGSMSLAARVARLDPLKRRQAGVTEIVSNAKCLGEGVDIPELDAVVFVEPRKSQTDIVQIVGRAIRRARGTDKTLGHILLCVPLLPDEPEHAISRTAFAAIRQVLSALRDQDEAIVDEIDARHRPLPSEKDLPTGSRIRLHVPAHLSLEAFRSIETRIMQYCSRQFLPATHPGLCQEWSVRNPRPASFYTSGSNARVWWQCANGHEWEAVLVSRASGGHGCSVCIGRVASAAHNFAASHPDLAGEWHPARNERPASDYTPRSNAKVWWLCANGHEWPAKVRDRAAGHGCPICAGQVASPAHNFAFAYPDLAMQWHPTRNERPPTAYTPHSHAKVWWLCVNGHEWQAALSDRAIGKGCRICAGQVASPAHNFAFAYPDLAMQWHPTRNERPPTAYTPHSHAKVWWLCVNGHEWQAVVGNRARGRNCRFCAGQGA